MDIASRAQTVIANRGSRGDYNVIDPNDGSLLVTQSDRIVRLKFPASPVTSFRIGAPASVLAGKPFGTKYTGTITFTSSDSYPGVLPAAYLFTPSDHGTHTFLGVILYTAGDRL